MRQDRSPGFALAGCPSSAHLILPVVMMMPATVTIAIIADETDVSAPAVIVRPAIPIGISRIIVITGPGRIVSPLRVAGIIRIVISIPIPIIIPVAVRTRVVIASASDRDRDSLGFRTWHRSKAHCRRTDRQRE